MITQTAPDPVSLRELVATLRYRPGWFVELADDRDRGQGCRGTTLVVHVKGPDAYDHARTVSVQHFFPVPAAAYNARSWRRWLLDQLLLVEQHEACEFFQVGDERPYAPTHAPGNDPWTITETASAADAATNYLGQRVCPHCAGVLGGEC